MTPYQLFEKLVLRYCISPPNNSQANFKQTHQLPVRLRVLNVIKALIDHHFHDFEDDENMMNAFNNFMEVVTATGMGKMAEQLKTQMEKKISNSKEPLQIVLDKAPPFTLLPKASQYCLMDVDSLELARQVTLLEFDYFKQLRAKEFLKQGWTKKDKEARAPNLLNMIRLSNKVSNWVYSEIVSTEDLNQRAARIVKFIQVAQECKRLNNYNGVFEIVAGLSNSSVHRLKKTWSLVGKEYNDFLETMKDLQPVNFKKLREELRVANSPCIPYIG